MPGIKVQIVRLHRLRRLKRHWGRCFLPVPHPALIGRPGREARQPGGNAHAGNGDVGGRKPGTVIGLFVFHRHPGAVGSEDALHAGRVAMGLHLTHGRVHLQLQGLETPLYHLALPFHIETPLGHAVQRHGKGHGPGGEGQMLQVALVAGGAHDDGAFRLQFHGLDGKCGERPGIGHIHIHTAGFHVKAGFLRLPGAAHVALDGLGGGQGPFVVLVRVQHRLQGLRKVQPFPYFVAGGAFREGTFLHLHTAYVGPFFQNDGHLAGGCVNTYLPGPLQLQRNDVPHHPGVIQVVGKNAAGGQQGAEGYEYPAFYHR